MKISALLTVCFLVLLVCESADAQSRLPRGAMLARPLKASIHGGIKFADVHGHTQKVMPVQKGYSVQKGYVQKSYTVPKGYSTQKACDQCCSSCGDSVCGLPGLAGAFERVDEMLNRIFVCHKFGVVKCDSDYDDEPKGCGCSVKSSCGCSVQKSVATPYYSPSQLPDAQIDPFEDDDISAPLPPPLLDRSTRSRPSQPTPARPAANSASDRTASVTAEATVGDELQLKSIKLINFESPTP